MTQKKTRISRIPCAISGQGPTNYPLHFVGHRHNQCIVMSFESDLNKTASTEEHDYYTVDKHDHIQILLAYIRYDQILAAKQEPTKITICTMKGAGTTKVSCHVYQACFQKSS